MRHHLHRLVLGIALSCLAMPSVAQDTSPLSTDNSQVDEVLDGPLAKLPESMFGIECREAFLDGVQGSAMCWDQNKWPIVSIYTYALGHDLSYESLVKRMHHNFRDVGAVQVINEEPFVVASAPGATAMRGLYQTEKAARKLTWSVAYQGNFTRVMVSVNDNSKLEDLEDEVMTKVFGPDRYVSDASAAQ